VSPAELIECREAMHTQLGIDEKENVGYRRVKAPHKRPRRPEEWSDALHVLYAAAQQD
jgi:hypothetical protein